MKTILLTGLSLISVTTENITRSSFPVSIQSKKLNHDTVELKYDRIETHNVLFSYVDIVLQRWASFPKTRKCKNIENTHVKFNTIYFPNYLGNFIFSADMSFIPWIGRGPPLTT